MKRLILSPSDVLVLLLVSTFLFYWFNLHTNLSFCIAFTYSLPCYPPPTLLPSEVSFLPRKITPRIRMSTLIPRETKLHRLYPDTSQDIDMEATNSESLLKSSQQQQKSQYGKQEYWNDFYYENQIFSWYAEWKDIKPFMDDFVSDKNQSRILLPGIGNDSLFLDMYRDGYRHITAMDYAPEAIKRCHDMIQTYQQQGQQQIMDHNDSITDMNDTTTSIQLLLADARNLQNVFMDKEFDIIFEKGTLDAIYLSGESNKTLANENLYKAWTELCRCLTPDDGIFISIACVATQYIYDLFQQQDNDSNEWECLIDKDELYISEDGYTSNNIDGTIMIWQKKKKKKRYK